MNKKRVFIKVLLPIILIFILGFAGMMVGNVIAENNSYGKIQNEISTKRVIANTTGFIDRLVFRIRGCKTVHKLNDATAMQCPSEKVSKLKVKEDKLFYITDVGANLQIRANDVWELGYTGSGVTVAILDSGIDLDNSELVDSIVGGEGFGYPTYEDDHGHGTHVAGIITANGVDEYAKGVAPDAKVWIAKVCDYEGYCYESDIIAAIEYIVDNNIAEIISMSLGGDGTSGVDCDEDYVAEKVNWAVDKGVTVVAAAGNAGGFVSTPACASKAIAVGAVDKYNDLRADWSGTGLALDIMAPGVSIYSTISYYGADGYDSWSGTSMATPHISAAVALLKQVNPSLTDAQIKDALYKTAKDLGTPGWDRYYGWGRVDILAAVNNYINQTVPEEPEPPVPPEPEPPEPTECTADYQCPADGWFDNGRTQWLSSGQCTEKEQKEQEYRNYYCNSTSKTCQYLITQTRWTDTNRARNKIDSTPCNDGNSCKSNDACSSGVCTGTPITGCINSDGCCPTGCTSTTDSDCSATTKCWSGSNKYLDIGMGIEQASKFCRCASGTYGFSFYDMDITQERIYQYVDARNNENWAVIQKPSMFPDFPMYDIAIYEVRCKNSIAYLTNKDYYSK
ncbi:hypothetical protein A3K73_04415 [Candidatus Pacearchaeota archaeon RBG_13_36_9]|nr:MAG: hypothetical protein A3K73_04415 [Candidatus Pacearchaeota archaeon RBG_13_36_9]